MVPGAWSACIASTMMMRSASSISGSASRKAVPTSSVTTFFGNSSCRRARATCTPTPSSQRRRLPIPRISVLTLRSGSCVYDHDGLSFFGTHHVHRAGKAGVKGMDHAQHLDRLGGVDDRGADQRLLNRTLHAVGVLRRGVPAGGGD